MNLVWSDLVVEECDALSTTFSSPCTDLSQGFKTASELDFIHLMSEQRP